jgi:ribonucleoside-diphosphate reductase alpha chain
MERANRFAKNQRTLGIGWLGYHTYLQKNSIPFESMQAKRVNAEIAKTINDRAWNASKAMAIIYGEPELCKGIGIRNVTMTAIAPTKSSSFIHGQVSEGIEPHNSNYFIKDLAKIKYTIRNHELEQVLQSMGRDTDKTWDLIMERQGSVQHLDFLDDHQKAVFKTMSEISQMEIVQQAAQRQKWIDQGQSLNLRIHPSTPLRDVNALVIEAWRLGIKSLYYQYGVNAAQEFSKSLLTCSSCES